MCVCICVCVYGCVKRKRKGGGVLQALQTRECAIQRSFQGCFRRKGRAVMQEGALLEDMDMCTDTFTLGHTWRVSAAICGYVHEYSNLPLDSVWLPRKHCVNVCGCQGWEIKPLWGSFLDRLASCFSRLRVRMSVEASVSNHRCLLLFKAQWVECDAQFHWFHVTARLNDGISAPPLQHYANAHIRLPVRLHFYANYATLNAYLKEMVVFNYSLEIGKFTKVKSYLHSNVCK